ncbi:MAG TPA: hypothetical protein VLD64_07175 [Nitrosarchaeum sp.]|nr:hypothetical protein [Nitrosarchaeum sp.]
MAITLLLILPNTVAHAESSETITITPINDKISLEKTSSIMDIPKNKELVWGMVKGGPSDYVERYPVIIQFFKEGEPVHVAQVKVKGDGSYEYKFKIRNTDQNTGKITDIFEGKYTVKIFKVIHNKS